MDDVEPQDDPKIAIALSGGGSRAIAFHLGCLRALHSVGVLQRAEVLSCVSGGSVIGGLYVTHPGDFEDFEGAVRKMLRKGFIGPALRTALTSREGLRAAICRTLLFGRWVLRTATAPVRWSFAGLARHFGVQETEAPSVPWRFASRTTILEETMDRMLFHGRTLKDVAAHRPKFVAMATELRTGSAFYFSPEESGCWRFGKVNPDRIRMARAVAASAAYPILLPAVDAIHAFNKSDNSIRRERVTLTDGGVYDNLGVAPLWPDRDPSVSVRIPRPDIIIACRAGYGLRFAAPTVTLLGRMSASVLTTLERARNAAIQRLHDLHGAGKQHAILMPYLGRSDARFACAPVDRVKREEVDTYPTDFRAMSEDWIERLSKRGEQVTLAIIREKHPDLMR